MDEGLFGFSWNDQGFKRYFEEPFELKEGMRVRMKDPKDCESTDIISLSSLFFEPGAIVTVKKVRSEMSIFSANENPYWLSLEWIEEVIEIPEEKEELSGSIDVCQALSDAFDAYLEEVSHNVLGIKPYYKEPSWTFETDKPNWNLLCADLLSEEIPLAFVSDGDNHYVIGVWNEVFDWDRVFIKHLIIKQPEIPMGSYSILKVGEPEECKELVEKMTKRYNNWHRSTRKKAINRSKTLKKKKKFEVFTY